MTQTQYQIRQLADVLQPPDSGKQSVILLDDAHTKVVLFAFAAGHGLTEHVAPFPAFIQIITGGSRTDCRSSEFFNGLVSKYKMLGRKPLGSPKGVSRKSEPRS